MENNKRPLKIALHGMDDRTTKTMMMFLQGPCRGIAIVVKAEDADIDVFDGDAAVSKKLLEKQSQEIMLKPVIVISLQDFVQEGTLHIKKPVKTSDMVLVLGQAKRLIDELSKKAVEIDKPSAPQAVTEEPRQPVAEPEMQELKTFVADNDERNKTSKHQTAMRLDEKSFHEYIGSIEDMDVNDPTQFGNASYNPNVYFQGYIQSAFAACASKSQILLLQSDWRPITLFPRTQEVWLDGNDLELKTFAEIKLKHKVSTTTMTISPIDPKTMSLGGSFDKFQSMEAFLWKLACWTSKGRYPQDIDYKQPVFLKNWPNFTRLLITPHALRIAALLIEGPRTMVNVAQALNIKPQYVFVFISAAHAVGLAGQIRRSADSLAQAQDIQPRKGQGLLSRILSKLRGK